MTKAPRFAVIVVRLYDDDEPTSRPLTPGDLILTGHPFDAEPLGNVERFTTFEAKGMPDYE